MDWLLDAYLSCRFTVCTGRIIWGCKSRWCHSVKRFLNVTIPMLAPSITICVVGITTGSLKVYDLLVSSTKAIIWRASTSMIYQTYTTAINGRQYGYGCAMSVTLVIVLLLVAFVQVKGLKSKEVQAWWKEEKQRRKQRPSAIY